LEQNRDYSNHDPLDLMQGNLIPAPIIQTGRAGRFMGCNLLCHFQSAAVLEISRNARCPEGVAAR
jgi:hypothetical protein